MLVALPIAFRVQITGVFLTLTGSHGVVATRTGLDGGSINVKTL